MVGKFITSHTQSTACMISIIIDEPAVAYAQLVVKVVHLNK